MTRINSTVSAYIDAFLIRSNTGHCTGAGEGTRLAEYSLFAHSDDRKRVVLSLQADGFNPFKRGTKEPERIQTALLAAKWEEIKTIDPNSNPNVHTFADQF